MIILLNGILGLDDERRSPKTLILLTFSMLLLGMIGILKAYIVFIVLYTILFLYCLFKLVIKTHIFYISTLLLILAEVSYQLDYYFTGGSNLTILSWVLFGLAMIINLAVLVAAIIRIRQNKEYASLSLFILFNLLVVGLIFLITNTYSITYTATNGGAFSTPTTHFVFKFLYFVVFFFVVLLGNKLLKKSDEDTALENQQTEPEKTINSH